MFKLFIFSFFLFIVSNSINAQQWIVYGGLPSITTRIAAVDDTLNVWVTNFGGGLSKAKNQAYINYNSSNSGLTDNFTTGIDLDAYDNKWIGTYNSGVFVYNGTNWIQFNTSNGLPGNRINCVTIDPVNNNKWFGINFNGATKFDGTTFTTYKSTNSPLPNNNVNCITTESNGNVWIGTYNGLAKLNGTNWTIYTVGSTSADNQIYSVAIENSTNIWIGTGGGLWKFDGTSTWTNYNTGNSGLPYDYVSCVKIDQSNNKWIGTTQGGMAKFDGTTWTQFNTSNSQIPGMDVRGITIDVNNNLWITTNDGGLAFYGTPPVVGPSTDATLSDLKTDGVTVSGFSPSIYTYNILLPFGTTNIPVVTATTNHNLATKVISNATSLPGSATVVVTAEDGTTSLTYTINFTIASPSTNAALSDLKVNGTTVNGFSPTLFSYGVTFPYGTTTLPAITATTADINATKIITNANTLPGTGTVAVTAQDGITSNTYSINFSLAPANTDASLSNLLVNGSTINNFNPTVYDYYVELPYGTVIVPSVTATPSFINANAQITNASSLPGTTTILVTAEDGTTTHTYNIHFTVAAANTDATLSDLQISGITVQGFSSSTYDYNVELPYGTTIVPNVTAVPTYINATTQITNAPSLPGTTIIVVTAEDGTTTQTYNIHFTIATGIESIYNNRILVYPNPSHGEITIFNDEAYDITISDISNRIIFMKNKANNNVHIDLKDFGSGSYFVQIRTSEKSGFYKIIIL